jgi:hypothetical protein
MIQIDELDRSWIISLLAEGYSTYDIVKRYTLTEELILECQDLLDKEVIVECLDFSEEFIESALSSEYFSVDDLNKLTMGAYSKMSPEFIEKYSDKLNWNKIILYVSTQSDNFDNYISVINQKNLWSTISANDLDIEFIRQWKDKLDWRYLSMVKEFSDDEKEEFSNYIIVPENSEIEGDFIDKSQFEFVKKMSDEELEDLIEEINKHLSQR